MLSSVYLKITNRCNIRCRHCFIKNYSGDMDLQVVNKVSERFPEAKIIFHGGEPTLMGVDYIRKCIDLLGERTYIIQSNLIDFNRSFIPLIQMRFQSQCGSSLDSSRIPYISGWLRTVQLLSANGIGVTAVVTLTREMNTGELIKYIDAFEKAGGNAFRLQFVSPVRTGAVDMKHYMEVFRELYDHPLNESKSRAVSSICSGNQLCINGGNCAQKTRTIDPDGTVYICPDLAGQCIFPAANVMDNNFGSDLTEVESMFMKREKRFALTCSEDCWRACRGGCFASSYFNTLDPLSKDPYCELYREILDFTRSRARNMEGDKVAV